MRCEICGKRIWWYQKQTSRCIERGDRRWDYGGYTIFESIHFPKKYDWMYSHVDCVIEKAEKEERKERTIKAQTDIARMKKMWREKDVPERTD